MPKSAPATVAVPAALSAVETLAVARCFKDKAIETARAGVAEGTTHQINMKVQIVGTVIVGNSTPGSSGETTTPAKVDLKTFPMLCALLRHLKVRPSRIAEALAEIALDAAQDEALAELFATAEDERARALPAVSTKWSSNGKAASITATLTATKLP